MPQLLVPSGTVYVQTASQVYPIDHGTITVPDGHPDLTELLNLGFSVAVLAEPVTTTAPGTKPRKGEHHA